MKKAYAIAAGAFLAWSSVTFGAPGGVIRPRPAVEDYPAHESVPAAALGAALLTARQVRTQFSTDLNRDYLVLEVAVYPVSGQAVAISREDFFLKASEGSEMLRPAEPGTVAAAVYRGKAPSLESRRPVDVTTGASIGYENGTDPYTGRRVHGVDTAAGVGVGVGPDDPRFPPPSSRGPSIDRDPNAMEYELSLRELPARTTKTPIAGYLYFPLPKKAKKDASYHLQYAPESGDKAELVVPAKTK